MDTPSGSTVSANGVSNMDALGELPTIEELEELAEILLNEYSIANKSNPLGDELIIAIGTIYECISLRKGIDRVIETCTDHKAVAYLKELMEKTNRHYIIIGDAEAEE
jgi:hypothetical protein